MNGKLRSYKARIMFVNLWRQINSSKKVEETFDAYSTLPYDYSIAAKIYACLMSTKFELILLKNMKSKINTT